MEARVGIEPAYTELQDELSDYDLFFIFNGLIDILRNETTLIQSP